MVLRPGQGGDFGPDRNEARVTESHPATAGREVTNFVWNATLGDLVGGKLHLGGVSALSADADLCFTCSSATGG